MNEPLYDEDIVNLGYLRKYLNNEIKTDGNNEIIINKTYISRPQPPYNAGDTWIDNNIIYTCKVTRNYGIFNANDWQSESGAKDLATRKSIIFTSQPYDYEKGDLWILQTDTDHTAGKKGEMLVATTKRLEYNSADWIEGTSYCDIKYLEDNYYDKVESDEIKEELDAKIITTSREVSTEVYNNATGTIMTLLNNGYLTAEQVNALVEGNTEEIITIKNQLKQTITDSQMQIAISTALEGGISYFKNTLFTINEEGMWIATNQDEFNALYNNKGMYLYSYEQMIAKFDVNGATLNNLKVLGTIETPHSKKVSVTVNSEERVYDFWID